MLDLYKSLSHSKWDASTMSYSCPSGGARRSPAKRGTVGPDFPCLGKAEGVPDYRRVPDAGPCAYVHRDSAQTPGGFGDRVSEGQERHRGRPAKRQRAELYWRALVGPWVRCFHGRI